MREYQQANKEKLASYQNQYQQQYYAEKKAQQASSN
jgi:hypothetical protein